MNARARKFYSWRYAEALFKVASVNNIDAQVLKELSLFSELLKQTPQILDLLNNPKVGSIEKREFISHIIKDELCVKLFDLLISKSHVGLIKDIYKSFKHFSYASKQILPVKLYSAAMISESEEKNITEMLQDKLGNIQLHIKISPSLIAGAKLKVKDCVLDFSFKNQLNKIGGIV